MDFIRVHPCSLLTNLPSSDLHHGFFASSGFPISGRAGRTPSALKRNGVRVASLDDAGTDARYRGLTGLPRTLIRPSDEQLDGLPADFPEVAVVSDLARLMVEIDARFDHLTLAQKAGWITPPDHPDIDPPHEALLLTEHYREASRLKAHTDDFGRRLKEAEEEATRLEQHLRAKRTGIRLDEEAVRLTFDRVSGIPQEKWTQG